MRVEFNSPFTEEVSAKSKIDIRSLVKTKLPPLSASALRMSGLLRDPDTPTRKLAEAIGCDPSLTTRILRLANSPIYYLQKNVTSIQQAIEVIGTRSVYDILMMAIAADNFSTEIRGSVTGRLIWEHSLAVGLLAKELCAVLRMRGVEEAFICGLLHDIGKIMLLRADPQTYANVLEKNDEAEMLLWEEEVFGYDHAEVGALVAGAWQLPEYICDSILYHHNPTQATHSSFIAHLVVTADTVSNFHGYGLRLEQEGALAGLESALVLRLGEDQLHAAWDNIQGPLQEVINSF